MSWNVNWRIVLRVFATIMLVIGGAGSVGCQKKKKKGSPPPIGQPLPPLNRPDPPRTDEVRPNGIGDLNGIYRMRDREDHYGANAAFCEHNLKVARERFLWVLYCRTSEGRHRIHLYARGRLIGSGSGRIRTEVDEACPAFDRGAIRSGEAEVTQLFDTKHLRLSGESFGNGLTLETVYRGSREPFEKLDLDGIDVGCFSGRGKSSLAIRNEYKEALLTAFN